MYASATPVSVLSFLTHNPEDGSSRNLLQFTDSVSSIIPDTYRDAAFRYWHTIVESIVL